jgi:hypothetical protein
MKNLLINILLVIMLTACSNGTSLLPTAAATLPLPTKTFTPQSTATTTDTPTITPTPTQEPLNPVNFKVVDGKIQENVNGTWKYVQPPPEFGAMTEVELHEGKMYGIDTIGRAMVVKNDSGEWVKYERPIHGADFEHFYPESSRIRIVFNTENLDLSEIPAEKIVRFTNEDGSNVNWGYISGTYSWAKLGIPETEPMPMDEKVYSAEFSGYFLGLISGDITFSSDNFAKKVPVIYYVIEVPLKYERQIFVIAKNLAFKDNYGLNSDGTYTGKTGKKVITSDQFYQLCVKNETNLRGKQIIFPVMFQPIYAISMGGYKESPDLELWRQLVKGEGLEYKGWLYFMPQGDFWIKDSYMQ